MDGNLFVSFPRLRGKAGMGACGRSSSATSRPHPNPPPQAGEGIVYQAY
ncbi:MAG: hypothetical protein JWQ90_1473 [Hydrocarboniphaga sp.]|nr:hypothetical protein [Hydrocarboniphaga sp.]